MIQFTCTKDLCRNIHKKIDDTKNILCSHQFIEKQELRKYLSGILSIGIDESYLEKKKIISSMILATLRTKI